MKRESLPNSDTKNEKVNKRNENECGLKLPFHVTVVCSVTWPLDDSEAGVDLVLSCKCT